MTKQFLRAGAALGMTVGVALAIRVTTVSATPAQQVAKFAWPGVYDVVGTGFPEGEREAVMSISKVDTAYTLVALNGPPGSLVSFNVAGDSAHVIWNLGRDHMVLDLRGTGDSLTGTWSTSDWRGQIRGARRRWEGE